MPAKYESSPLPSDPHAERVILASILAENEIFFEGAADLVATDFSLDSHQKIFTTVNTILFGLVDDVDEANLATVADELKKKRQLATVGGLAFLSDLSDDALNRSKSLTSYIAILKEKARLRRLLGAFSSGQARVAEQNESAAEIVADIQNQLVEEAADGKVRATRIGDVTTAVEARVEEKRVISDERDALGLTWGVHKMDEFTRGAHDGEVTVCGGESGGGKTGFALQMVGTNAEDGTPCAIFSMEMSKEKLVSRCYPQMSEIITADMMRDPRLINLHTHIPEMKRISDKLNRLPIWIDDSTGLDITTIVARIRMMRRKYDIRLFVLDYLQLIQNKNQKDKLDKVGDTMFRLRDLVKIEPTIHILVLSQYSKAEGFTKNKRRTRSDLYGGSTIHQAAQNVVLLTVEDEEKKEKGDLLAVEFRFDKHRDGRKGKIVTYFDRAHLKYTEPATPLHYTQGDDF